ncbi:MULTISPECIES: MarR family winged helix-turn-helix transcriptional regulator [Niastella]|nr:MarR family transcriptional regulator [Niastella soli]
MAQNRLPSSLRMAVATLHKALRKQASYTSSYSMTELETIGFIARNNFILASELAVLTRITTQSMSQILKKFESQGLITRTGSPDDKRKSHISLTPAGEKLVKQNRYERDAFLQKRIETLLTDKEVALLEKVVPILDKLAAAD